MFDAISVPFGAKMLFNAKFSALIEMCSDTNELGYEMLWQGESEDSVTLEARAARSA